MIICFPRKGYQPAIELCARVTSKAGQLEEWELDHFVSKVPEAQT